MANKTTDPSLRFWKKVSKTDYCWEWIGSKYYNGYGQFFQNPNKIVAHRFAYQEAFGEISKDLVVCHKCDNRSCVNPSHLFAGTTQDNVRDMINKGRQVKIDRKGTKNGRAKVTEEEVLLIINRYNKGGISSEKLGAEFGLSETQTLRIINGESWSHLINKTFEKDI